MLIVLYAPEFVVRNDLSNKYCNSPASEVNLIGSFI